MPESLTIEQVSAMYRAALPPGGSGTLDDRRAGYDELLARLPVDPRVSVRAQNDPRRCPGFWVEPLEEPTTRRSALLLHGGGYILGSARGYVSLASRMAAQGGLSILVAEYPLAPENPYPRALNLVRQAWSEVIDAGDHSFLIGDSAGGGLAMSLACEIRDENLPAPRAIALISPLTDLRASSDTYEKNAAVDPICSQHGIRRAAELYLEGVDPADVPRTSPVLDDLSRLPPLLIQVGTDEVLLGDSTSLAAATARAGGAVSLEVFPRMVHVWPLFWSGLPEASTAIDRMITFFDAQELSPTR